jgi:hypothetical protein
LGKVRDFDTSAWTAGDTLWLSPTVAGGFVVEQPFPPYQAVKVGHVIISDATAGVIRVKINEVADVPQTLTLSMPLNSVSIPTFLVGDLTAVVTGRTGSFSTTYSLANNHLFVKVNSLTGSGNITITGDSLSETTAVPVYSDTETITVDTGAGQYYQSSKKFYQIHSVTIPAGITAINYDLGVVGYTDFNNQDFSLLSLRADIRSRSVNPVVRIQLIKIQDDGDKKMSIIYLEDMAVDATAGTTQVIDYIRSGAEDRSYDVSGTDVWKSGRTFVIKQGDYEDYWEDTESNHFNSGSADEGMIIGFPAATAVDSAAIQVRFLPV